MKDKIQVSFTESGTVTTLKTTDNLERSFNIINLIIKN